MIGLLRLAARNLLRSWRRQIPVIALIAIPVGLGAYAAIGERTTTLSAEDQFASEFGSAEAGLYDFPADGSGVDTPLGPDGVDGVVRSLTDAGAEVLVVRRAWVNEQTLIDVDLDEPLAQGLIRSIDGRAPERDGEVAVSLGMAERRGIHLGDTLPSPWGDGAEVVGIVTPIDVSSGYTYLPHGSLATNDRATVAIGYRGAGVATSTVTERLAAQGRPFGPQTPDQYSYAGGDEATRTGAVVTSALLVEAALLAAAAFAVRGRRRVVEFGRLLAIGAGPAEIRRTMLLEAGLIGAAAGLLGAGAAAAYAIAAPRHLEFALNNLMGWETNVVLTPRIALLDLVVPALLAVVGAVSAAWFPARAAGRMGAARALGEGAARSNPGWRALLAGVAAGGLGVVLVVDAASSGGGPFGAVLGFALLVGGAAICAAVGLHRLERALPDVAPLRLRLAVRDSSRHHVRSAVALTATAVVVGVGVMVMTLVSGDRAQATAPPLPTDPPRLATWGGGWGGGTVDIGAPSGSLPSIADVEEHLGIGRAFVLEEAADTGRSPGDAVWSDAPVVVVDDELAEALGLSERARTALDTPGTLVDLNDWYPEIAEQPMVAIPFESQLPVERQLAQLTTGILASPQTATELGIPVTSTGLMVVGDTPFTDDELARLEELGFHRSWASSAGDDGTAVGAGGRWVREQLIAAAIVAGLVLVLYRILSALITVETDDAVATMVSVGGRPGLRRSLAGTQALLHVTAAVTLAIPVGLVLAEVLDEADNAGRNLTAPWVLLMALCGLPLLTGLFVAATTGRIAPTLSTRLRT